MLLFYVLLVCSSCMFLLQSASRGPRDSPWVMTTHLDNNISRLLAYTGFLACAQSLLPSSLCCFRQRNSRDVALRAESERRLKDNERTPLQLWFLSWCSSRNNTPKNPWQPLRCKSPKTSNRPNCVMSSISDALRDRLSLLLLFSSLSLELSIQLSLQSRRSALLMPWRWTS